MYHGESWADALDEVVEELLSLAPWREPPIDALILARDHLGLQVCLDAGMKNRGRAQRGQHGRFIFIRPEEHEERRQWAVAHEIGEHWRSRLLQKLGLKPGDLLPQTMEELANRFASRLLVPSRWLAGIGAETGWDLIALKQRFATASHEVIAWRTLELPTPSIVSIIDQGRLSQRRSNSWPAPRTLTPIETRCQRVVHERGEPFVLVEMGWQVQGWPIHQPSWKREILRSTWEAEDFLLG